MQGGEKPLVKAVIVVARALSHEYFYSPASEITDPGDGTLLLT